MGSCQNNKVDQAVIVPLEFTGLRLTCKSWLKTYHNLFDYNAKDNINETTLCVNRSTRIIKVNKNYQILQLDEKLPQNGVEGAIDLIDNKDGSFLYRSILAENDKQNQNIVRHFPWLVIKSLPCGKYAIKEGDIIRLGKQKVKVKEIIHKDKYQDIEEQTIQTKHKVYNDLNKEASQNTHQSPQENPACRVCLDQGQQNNPLIAPCKCTGSAKYIHLTCIQQWLTKSINPRTVNMATVITWKPLVCQLCATPLPFKIYLDGKKYFTVKIPRPARPYLVLNPIYKEQQNVKVYLMVSFSDKNSLLMGRKKDSDIRVSDDASVSRHHTIFTYNEINGKGKFYIQDNNSKYGTLVFLKKNLLLKPNLSGISLQMGGDLLRFEHGFAGQKQVKLMDEIIENINQSESSASDEDQESEQGAQNAGGEQQNNEQQPNNAPITNTQEQL